MKIVMLAMVFILSAGSAPAFAQAPNDRASKLQAGEDYSRQRHAARVRARANAHAKRVVPPMVVAPPANP